MQAGQEDIATTLMSLRRVPQHLGGPGIEKKFASQGAMRKGQAEVAPEPPLCRAPSLQSRQNADTVARMEEVPKLAYCAPQSRSWHMRMEEDTKSRSRMWNGRRVEQPLGRDMPPSARTTSHSMEMSVDMWRGSSSYNPYYKNNMGAPGYASSGASRATTYVHSEPTLYSSASSWGNPMDMKQQQPQQQHARSVISFPPMRDMNPMRTEAKSAPNTHMGVPPALGFEGMVPLPQSQTVNPTPPATPRGRWTRTDLLRQPRPPAPGRQIPIPAIVIDSGERYPSATQVKKLQPNKPFACDICQKRFGTRSLVKRHKMIHSDSRPHPCPDCPKRFRQREHLIKHQRLHTGERPFKCPHCPMDFVQKSTMTGHIRTRHSHEKVVQCNGCGERFYTRNHLRNHRPRCPALAGVLGFM